MNDYDAVVSPRYRKSKELPFRVYSEIPNHLALLGELSGKSVLDLACGEGFYTRLIKRGGARRVVGVDLSPDMIRLARAEEEARPLSIEYVNADAANLIGHEPFDVVSAAFLFCNASGQDVLEAMARAAFAQLAPGGRLVATDSEMGFHPGIDYRPYGMNVRFDEPVMEGARYSITFALPDGEEFTLHNYRNSHEAQESAFRKAGFQSVRWLKPEITPAGIAEYGSAFWRTYLAHPPVIRLECGN
jgi:SAM-dependent methyltransferase